MKLASVTLMCASSGFLVNATLPSGKATDLTQVAGVVCLAGEETEVQWGREHWECPEWWAWRKETAGYPAAVTIRGKQAVQGGPPSEITGSAL